MDTNWDKLIHEIYSVARRGATQEEFDQECIKFIKSTTGITTKWKVSLILDYVYIISTTKTFDEISKNLIDLCGLIFELI